MKLGHTLTRPTLVASFLGLLLLTAACSWSTPPRSADGFGPSFTLSEPIFERSTGEIFLLEQGLWAYVPEEQGSSADTFANGTLVEVRSLEGGAHVFTVVLERSWGLLLQRLDTGPIQAKSRARLSALEHESADNASRPGTCHGAGFPSEIPDCLRTDSVQRWHVYSALAGGASLELAPVLRDDVLPPARRLGQFIVDGGELRWFGPGSPPKGSWVAIGDHAHDRPTPLVRVAAFGCASEAMSSFRLEGISLDTWTDHRDALSIEGATYDLGVDALVRCTSDEIRALIPSLHRPLLSARGEFIGPALISYEPLILQRAPLEIQEALLQTAARVGAGDFSGADLWLEFVLANLPESRQRDELALRAMQIASAAGRAEAAIRAGYFGTRRSWNPENDKAWLLGMISVYRELDMRREAFERSEALIELIGREREKAWPLWQQWSTLRIKILQGKTLHLREFEEAAGEAQAQNLGSWSLIFKTMAFEHAMDGANREEARQTLEARYKSLSLGSLWSAYEGRDVYRACPTDPVQCSFDAYGRHALSYLHAWTEASPRRDLTRRLELTPVIDFRPGFTIELLDSPSFNQTETADIIDLGLAIYPFLDFEARARVLEIITARLTRAFMEHSEPELCKDHPSITTRARSALARGSATWSRSEDHQQGQSLVWLISHAIPAACASTATLLALIDDEARRSPQTAMQALPLLEAIQLRPASERPGPQILQKVGHLTARVGAGDACQQWNLASALAYASAGELEGAEAMVVLAGNCPAPGSMYAESRSLLTAFVQFEKTGSLLSIPSERDRNLLARLSSRTIPDDACVGAEALGFRIDDHLDRSIVALSRSVDVPPTTRRGLELRTYSAAVELAEASFLAGRRALAMGDPQHAAMALVEARLHWRSVGHKSGLARIAFLEEVLFDGDIDGYLSRDQLTRRSQAPLPQIALLRQGGAQRMLDEPSRDILEDDHQLKAIIAAAIIIETDDALGNRIAPHANHPSLSSLCQFHDDNDTVPSSEAL